VTGGLPFPLVQRVGDFPSVSRRGWQSIQCRQHALRRFDKRNQSSILVAMLRRIFLVTLTYGCVGLFAAELLASQAEQDFVQYSASPHVRVVPKLVYARYGERTLLLDLYLPMNLEKRALPGVIVVRGGGWMVNDRKRFAHIASALAERGLAAASIEYRSADEAAFPGAVQDVKAAVRWMRANSQTYGIDPEAIGTLGGSSGAHMALLAGLTVGVPEFEGKGGNPDTSSSIQGVVAMATPADLLILSPGNQETVAKFLHATASEDRRKWQWASPINHVARNGPPAGWRILVLFKGAAVDLPREPKPEGRTIGRKSYEDVRIATYRWSRSSH